jgi:hypothetical protein
VRRLLPFVFRPWALPLVVFALIGPGVAAFALAGPQFGLAVGALTAAAVVVFAARTGFDEPIEIARSADRRYRLLVVATEPVDDPTAVEAIRDLVADGRRSPRADPELEPQVLVIAPAAETRTARWLSDVGPARAGAGGALALSLAALDAAGLDADGRVGDGDPVQALEDALRTYPAREVALLTGGQIGDAELEDVRRRLDRPVREVAGPGEVGVGSEA